MFILIKALGSKNGRWAGGGGIGFEKKIYFKFFFSRAAGLKGLKFGM